jgi:hypothetical protein
MNSIIHVCSRAFELLRGSVYVAMLNGAGGVVF